MLPWLQNPALQLDNEDLAVNFGSLGLHDGLLKGLQEMGIQKPTNIQVNTVTLVTLALPLLMFCNF